MSLKTRIFVFLVCTASVKCQNLDVNNGSYTILKLDKADTSNKSAPRCLLEPEQTSASEEVIRLLEEGVRLIKYRFNVKEDRGPFSARRVDETLMIKPYDLVLASEGSGKPLLSLKEYFVPMSLYTLGYGVADISVDLIQTPFNCLENVTADDLEGELKIMILRNFGNKTSDVSTGREVCNQHIRISDSDVGAVKYSCCKLDLDDKIICDDLRETVWMYLLFLIITILQVIFVLYSPNFAPTAGRMGTKFIKYIYIPLKPLKLNVVTIDSNKAIEDTSFMKTQQFSFIRLTNLKKELRCLSHEILYTLSIGKVYLSVRASKILPDGCTPVTWVKFVKNFFVRCFMRKDLPALNGCCEANIFRLCGCIEISWLKFLTLFMRVVVAFFVISPWLVRVWFFYAFEEKFSITLSEKLDKNGLKKSYQGSLILYFTPQHSLFISIYVVILISLGGFIVLPPTAKRKLKTTIQTSLQNMKKTRKFDSFMSFVAHVLYPLEKFGIIGLLILPLWLVTIPVGLLILSCLIFPICNLTVRLLVNFIYYTTNFINPEIYRTFQTRNHILMRFSKRIRQWFGKFIVVNEFEARSRRNMLTHVVSLASCMLTIFVLLLIVVECIAFYVECVIYITIGIILNSKDVMKYLSLFVLIIWYAIDCFSAVSAQYKNFGKEINKAIQEKVGDALKTVAMCSKQTQQEQAFTVLAKNEGLEERMVIEAGTEGYLKWNARRLLLFLDKEDIPYMPKDFLFKAAKLRHFCCPGPVHMLYLKALVELICITMFLGFVMLVILAFGEANNISGANQTLATLASGFLPFAFRKFLIKSHSGPPFDKNNITWQNTLYEAMETYSKRWTFFDFEIIACDRNESSNKITSLTSNITDNVDIIVKIHKGDNTEDERLEFWARKSDVDKSEIKYIWTEPEAEGESEGIEMKEV